MTLNEGRYQLNALMRKMTLMQIGEISLISISLGLFTFAAARLLVSTTFSFVLAIVVTVTLWLFLFVIKKISENNLAAVLRLLHSQFPELEDSADLVAADVTQLTTLQRIQQEKVLVRLRSAINHARIANKIGRLVVVLVVSIISLPISMLFDRYQFFGKDAQDQNRANVPKVVQAKIPAAIDNLEIVVTPPAYTGIAKTANKNPNIVAPEGSTISWTIQFSSAVKDCWLRIAAQQKVSTKSMGESFSGNFKATSTTFYQIGWSDENGFEKSSDYYKIDVTKDHVPSIELVNVRQSTELTIEDKLSFQINSHIEDDHGLTDAYMIATVSKGSGESVKFREEKIRFSAPSSISGRKVNASRTIDLRALGMEPGDELYLYAEATDNRTPSPNKSRTETFFITLRDTASQHLSVEGGLGVDLMPDYFRSQRQIIIDTEKLLKDKRKLSRQQFNSTSNELGYDQKVLRLKYGEFLGEEFETRIGEVEPAEQDESTEDIAKKYTHAHDTENEHNLVEQNKDDHGNDSKNGDAKPESIADSYKHQHDDAETATFFNQSIRSKLKAALTEMWDAELYLRLYQPEKSLPFQYKALRLLKEISNNSRIYVHKTGFDPPPLKEDKRLTGELIEIKSTTRRENRLSPESQLRIKKAIQVLESRAGNYSAAFDEAEKRILQNAGNELAVIAIQKPGAFISALSSIRVLVDGNLPAGERRAQIVSLRKYLWLALDPEKISPVANSRQAHSLDDAFIKNLEDLKNE